MLAMDSPDDQPSGFPHSSFSVPFWLQGTHVSPLLGHRTTDTLPESAEVVIIGSGLSGAATAYFLLTGPTPPRTVVILESREACSGATGRNGGHCRPDCYRGYRSYKAIFGKEQAFKIIANEMDTLNLTQDIIEKEGIECDFWRGHSFDVAMNQKSADLMSAILQEYVADGAQLDGIVQYISDAEEAKRVTRCPSAQAAVSFPAASLWPYKLVLHMLLICINRYGLNLQTTTPVKAVHAYAGAWRVETERGVITGRKVVYATNAFTPTLLPEFEGKIAPFRSQCSALVPTKAYARNNTLSHTYVFRWGHSRVMSNAVPQVSSDNSQEDYDYLLQRPKDGIMILGGGRWKAPIEDQLGQTDDNTKLSAITEHFKKALGSYLENWGEEAGGEGFLYDWTGIVGHTPEAVPYVGAVNGKPGAFICAGHSGHGMARIMTCARGLAFLMRGESWAATGLPECFQPTSARLSLSSKSVSQIWLECHSQRTSMVLD